MDDLYTIQDIKPTPVEKFNPTDFTIAYLLLLAIMQVFILGFILTFGIPITPWRTLELFFGTTCMYTAAFAAVITHLFCKNPEAFR
jgi:hypothetical protein